MPEEKTEVTLREKIAEMVGVDAKSADNDEFMVGALTEFVNDHQSAVEGLAKELAADEVQKLELELEAAKKIDFEQAADFIRERREELAQVRREGAASVDRKGVDNIAEAAKAKDDIVAKAMAAGKNRSLSGLTALAVDESKGDLRALLNRKVTEDSPIKLLQRANDDLLLTAHVMGMSGAEDARVSSVRQLGIYPKLAPLFGEVAKAFDTGDASAWVPTFYSADLVENVYQTTDVASLFPRFPWPGAGGTATIPVEGADNDVMFTAGEATTDDSDAKFQAFDIDPGTSLTITARALASRIVWSYEMEEDSIIQVLDQVRTKFVRGNAREMDRALLDGDADGTHQDTGLSAAANDARRAFNGLRKKALADTTTSAATYFNAETFATPLLGMGAYAQAGSSDQTTAPAGCVAICSHATRLIMGFLRDTQDQRIGGTQEGLSAQRKDFLGYPIIPSAQVRNDLTTAGVYDASTTTQTYLLWVYTPAWHIYEKAGLTAEIIDRPEVGQRVMVGRQRLAFHHVYPAAADTTRIVLAFVDTSFT